MKQRYTAIRECLLPWSELWGHSILHRFAEMEARVPEPWFRFGANHEFSTQFAVGQGEKDCRAPASLAEWIGGIRALCACPRSEVARPLEPPFDRGLVPKKKHEIEAVLGFVRSEGISPARMIDIGGGAGHLARLLARELDCPVESIDRDPVLQEKGRRILGSIPWRDSSVTFVNGEFPDVVTQVPAQGTWAIGLHTCGRLAWSQLELARKGCSLLNFGCCYEKLDPAADIQRSRFVQERPLPFTEEALFVANRGGVERSLREFVFQQRVQQYRFTLHELLLSEGCRGPRFEAVGNASVRAYSGSFADYARDRLELMGGVSEVFALSDGALEGFRRSVEPRIERQRFVAFLRNLLARPLELAILLDRALLVEEWGSHDVRLLQFFDPTISPKNLGIVASRKPATGS